MTDTAPDIKEIFVEALDLASDAERAVYLDRACADEPDVRARVEALLGAIGQAGSFLEAPALAREASREPGAGRALHHARSPRRRLEGTVDRPTSGLRRGSATSSWSGAWVRGRWGPCSRRGR